jgi:uncharacterized protein YjiS (DUF1127 family)
MAIPGFIRRLLARRPERTSLDELRQLGPHMLSDVGVAPRDLRAAASRRRVR